VYPGPVRKPTPCVDTAFLLQIKILSTCIYLSISCKPCHEKNGPPQNGSPWSKYFKVFGPPGPCTSE